MQHPNFFFFQICDTSLKPDPDEDPDNPENQRVFTYEQAFSAQTNLASKNLGDLENVVSFTVLHEVSYFSAAK